MIRAEIVTIRGAQRIWIDAPASRKEDCQSIAGARWDKNSRHWTAPLSWGSCKALRGTFGTELEIGEKLSQWAKTELEERITPSLNLREALEAHCHGLFDDRLYPFQVAGAQFLFTAKQALLSDSMGAGKTVQVIAAAKARTSLPALVVCPASMRRTWGREVKKWWPGVPVYVVEGTKSKRDKILAEAADNPGFVIINFESVRLHSRLSGYGSIALSPEERTPKILNQIPFRLVVCDESHRLKDPKSKQTRAVWAVAHNPMVDYRWALTGTPLTHAPDTLWSILHFMDPNEWPSRTSFIERFCLKSFNMWGGLDIFGLRPDREEEFFEIFHPRFRRMPKEVVLPNLPPIVYETRQCEMGAKQSKCYAQMEERMFAETEDGEMAVASSPMVKTMRLLQFASSHVSTIDDNNKAILSDPSCKLDALMDDLPDLIQDDESLVVFANSRQLIRLLVNRLEKAKILHGVIEGGQSADVRQRHMDEFQAGKIQVICVVTAAGGVGITLSRARTGAFLQLPWSNVDYQQAIGRVHRIGSEIHKSVRIIHYLTTGTVEDSVVQALDGKAIMMEEVVRDAEALKRLLNRKKKPPT